MFLINAEIRRNMQLQCNGSEFFNSNSLGASYGNITKRSDLQTTEFIQCRCQLSISMISCPPAIPSSTRFDNNPKTTYNIVHENTCRPMYMSSHLQLMNHQYIDTIRTTSKLFSVLELSVYRNASKYR